MQDTPPPALFLPPAAFKKEPELWQLRLARYLCGPGDKWTWLMKLGVVFPLRAIPFAALGYWMFNFAQQVRAGARKTSWYRSLLMTPRMFVSFWSREG